jgi:hypothetical protein
MPFEDRDRDSDEISDILLGVELLCGDDPDCLCVVGGDINVDFSRDRLHTVLLRSFCEHLELLAAIDHPRSAIDFTSHFNMARFNTLDHFFYYRRYFFTVY